MIYRSKFYLLLLLLLLIFNGCKKSNKTKIGVCVTQTTKPVYTQMKKAMLENSEKFDVEIIWVGVKDDIKRVDYSYYQEELFYCLLEEGIKALIFNPIESQKVYSMVYSAKDKGVPVIALDKMVKDLKFDAFITKNEEEMGKQAAFYLVEQIQGRGNVIVLEGDPVNQKHRDIVLGFYKILDRYPEIRIISSPHFSETSLVLSEEKIRNLKKMGFNEEEIKDFKKKEIASEHVSSMLNRYAGNIQGIIACDSILIAGAVRAVDIYGLADRVFTIGVGASKDACSLLKPSGPNTSKHDMEIYSTHYARGYLALETAIKLINREKIEYDNLVPNGEVEVNALYGPIVKLTHKDYYSKVRRLWPELFEEEN